MLPYRTIKFKDIKDYVFDHERFKAQNFSDVKLIEIWNQVGDYKQSKAFERFDIAHSKKYDADPKDKQDKRMQIDLGGGVKIWNRFSGSSVMKEGRQVFGIV